MKKGKEKQNFNLSGVLAAVLLFLLLGIIGGCMLFVPEMKLIYFCYVVGGVFLAYGTLLFIRYFAKKEYELVSNYDFSAGLLIFILGMLTLIRAEEVSGIISVYLGIMVLVEGIILLQHTIQIKNMQGIWWVTLVLSTIMILFSFLVLLNIQDFMKDYSGFFFGFLFVIGILGIISQILVAVRTVRYRKAEDLKQEELLEEIDDLPGEKEEEIPVEDEDKDNIG